VCIYQEYVVPNNLSASFNPKQLVRPSSSYNRAMAAVLFTALLGIAPLVSALAPGLELVYSVDRPTQGIAISADGRKFLTQRYSTTLAPQVVELLSDNTTVLVSIFEFWHLFLAYSLSFIFTTMSITILSYGRRS
jgi:hypothetical protein